MVHNTGTHARELKGACVQSFWTNTKGLGGRIKSSPEDFVVDEIPAERPGKILIATMEKRNLTTPEAIKKIAFSLGIPEASIGFAGLKDKIAVTRQAISLERIGPSLAERVSSEELKLFDFRYGGVLFPGDLRGNEFTITIRDIKHDEKTSKKIVESFAKEAVTRGIPNYFGEQRFGKEKNNQTIGKDIVLGKDKMRGGFGRLMVNAYQSYLFNTALERFLGGKTECRNFDAIVPGYETRLGNGRYDKVLKEVMKEDGIKAEDFRHANTRGDKRKAFIKPSVAAKSFSPGSATVAFTLGPGEYATIVLRELMKSD
ncbi:MAG: tRNA pseudouridine(13) synthase TruD [Candidatus Aenigmarchaeota archaeon]|nr:tRNA pseudouridine(13) synthase TruD [Candidatus Aenigmarchaeota archaeon]